MRCFRAAALALPILLAACVACAKSAHHHSLTAVDRYLEKEMRRQEIPGLSLAVVRNGVPLYVMSYGVATLEHGVRTRPETVFQIGSIGKQFTAVAVMMLANEHRLDVDDPLLKYLPEIPASWNAVTPRLILNHQSGIPQLISPKRQLVDLAHDYTDAQLIELATSQPLDFEPGTDVSYSDTGYVLLGFVINRIAGMFYGDMLQQLVFAPLGMNHTRVISDADIVEIAELERETMALASDPFNADDSYWRKVVALRLRAGEASVAAAHAAMLHCGARGYLKSHRAQRRLREAYFVAIVTPATKQLRKMLADA